VYDNQALPCFLENDSTSLKFDSKNYDFIQKLFAHTDRKIKHQTANNKKREQENEMQKKSLVN
jgi:hypothetical protein